jgi:hypothetical protein
MVAEIDNMATNDRETDWTLKCVPGREKSDGTVSPSVWFVYNRARRGRNDALIPFATREEAVRLVNHPDNRLLGIQNVKHNGAT